MCIFLLAGKYLIVQELELTHCVAMGMPGTVLQNKIKIGMFTKTREYKSTDKCQYTHCDW